MRNPADDSPVEVDDLDGRALRDAVTDHSLEALRAACRRYVLAYRWCVTHPPTDAEDRAVMGDARLPGLGDDETSVGGEGTPGLATRAVSEYAALAGISTGAAIRILSDALDLHHRLPGLWRKVTALRVPAWTAAHIAQDTSQFSAEAAPWVDARLTTLDRYDHSTIDATIKQAMATFHPEMLRDESRPSREEWDVSVDHDACADGTSRLEATGDSLDLAKFHDLVCDEAAVLKHLGDTDGLGQRKAKALGVIADRQATLDLGTAGDGATEPDNAETTTPSVGAERSPATLPRRSYSRARLYLHLTLADLAASWDGDPARVGDAGRLGPQLLHQIETWLAACGSDAKVTR